MPEPAHGAITIEQDESRHAAFGVLMMRRVVRDAAPEQMAEMEDWAFGILEALNANQQLDMLHLLGPKYGIHPESVVKMVTALPNFADLNSLPYMHTVIPNLRNLGLLTERTRDRWIKLGMMAEKRVEAAWPGRPPGSGPLGSASAASMQLAAAPSARARLAAQRAAQHLGGGAEGETQERAPRCRHLIESSRLPSGPNTWLGAGSSDSVASGAKRMRTRTGVSATTPNDEPM
jgi:hypothetical protein